MEPTDPGPVPPEVMERIPPAALAAAFAVVACADGQLTQSEIDRFFRLISATPGLTARHAEAVQAEFGDITRRLMADYGNGLRHAESAVSDLRGRPEAAGVIRIAQVAIVADARLMEVEERVLQRLCTLLGLDPAAH